MVLSQHEMANRSLDIASLFDQDLNSLTDLEMGCLKLVAKNAPMDWYEVLESAGPGVVQSLQNKRLLIRRGDKLNLYWGYFFVIMFFLEPSHQSRSPTFLNHHRWMHYYVFSLELDDAEGKSLQQLANSSELQESTVRNIIHDLDQFRDHRYC